MMTWLRTVHWILSVAAVLQAQRNRSLAETNLVPPIEIREARFIASNAIRVIWNVELPFATELTCRLTLKDESISSSPLMIKDIKLSSKRFIFWNVSSERNYSVSISLLPSERLLVMSNVDVSRRLQLIHFEARQPVVLNQCYIHIRNGFTKNLDLVQLNEVIFTEHDFITLSCKITGKPNPSIRWLKDGKELIPSDKEDAIDIDMADKSNEGTYSCVAENQFGQAVFPGVRLKMAVLDSFPAVDQTPKLTVSAGVGLKIDCHYSAQSVPAPTIRWYKLQHKNDPSPSPVHLDNSRRLLSLTGSLVFVNTESGDTGLYMCMARNSELDKSVAGSLTYLEVTEARSPTFNTAPQLLFKSLETQKAFVGDKVYLQCIFSGRPVPDTMWYVKDPITKVDLIIVEESSSRFPLKQNGTILVINGIDEFGPDQFTCDGRNPEGRSQSFQFQLLIYGKPLFVVEPKSQNATEGDTVVFSYKVTGIPHPEIQWTFRGRPLTGPSIIRNETSLTMINVTKESTCGLQLNVTNVNGFVLTNVFLNVFSPTMILSEQENVTAIKSNLASFYCDAETDPATPLEIAWLSNSKLIWPSADEEEGRVRIVDQTTLVVDLTSEDSDSDDLLSRTIRSNYTCLASNGITISSRTFTISMYDDRLMYPHSLRRGESLIAKNHYSAPDSSRIVSYSGYAACAVVLLILIVVVAFHLKKRRLSRLDTVAAAGRASAIGSITNSYEGSSLSSVEFKRPTANKRLRGSWTVGQRFDGTRAGLLFACSNSASTTLQDMYIPRDRLQITETIAQGRFVRTFAAFLRDPRGELRETVAVRGLNHELVSDMVELFLKEPETVRDMQHINVLGVLGVTFNPNGDPLIVLPFMSNGNLRNFIVNKQMDMTVLHLLQLGLQVVQGMAYLSHMPVVHGHLRTEACMVNSRGIVKVADFGLTRELIMRDCYRQSTSGLPLVMRWLSIETLEASVFSTMSDVWSFGVLLWELMTRGALPFSQIDDFDILNQIQSGQTLSQPQYCPDCVYSIMKACWSLDPSQRPKFDTIEEAIAEIVQSAQRRNRTSVSAFYVNLAAQPSLPSAPAQPPSDLSSRDLNCVSVTK